MYQKLMEGPNLEAHASLDLLVQHLGDNAVKVLQHLNRNLWLYLAIANELVERICHGGTDADIVSDQHTDLRWVGSNTCYAGTTRRSVAADWPS